MSLLPGTVTIKCTRLSAGRVWPIEIEFLIDGISAYRGLVEETDRVLGKLAKAGLVPDIRTITSTPPQGTAPKPGLLDGDPVPPPICPDHKEEMAVSKYQRNELGRSYYCPQKNGIEYCRVLGSVNLTTGKTKTWKKEAK